MENLNDEKGFSKLDPSNQLQVMEQWLELIKIAQDAVSNLKIPNKVNIKVGTINYSKTEEASAILIIGMGGSAISGNFFSVLAKKCLKIPVLVSKDYSIPSFINESSIVIAISYSGNTEETISSLSQALRQKAMVVGITSGGILKEFADQVNMPYVHLPSGYQPRMSLPLLFISLLETISKLGVPQATQITNMIPGLITDINDLLPSLHPSISTANNIAKRAAKFLHGKIPFVIAEEECLAIRVRGEFNENSNIVALDGTLPELFHNHVAGWEDELINQCRFLVFQSDLGKKGAVHEKVSYLHSLSAQKDAKMFIVSIKGKNPLSMLLQSVLIGDYISVYLAFLADRNPETIKMIVQLKKKFGEREERLKINNSLTELLP